MIELIIGILGLIVSLAGLGLSVAVLFKTRNIEKTVQNLNEKKSFGRKRGIVLKQLEDNRQYLISNTPEYLSDSIPIVDKLMATILEEDTSLTKENKTEIAAMRDSLGLMLSQVNKGAGGGNFGEILPAYNNLIAILEKEEGLYNERI